MREFVAQLRDWKDTSGFTLLQVAAKTGYSRASWERYFAGRTLPPREAVEAFVRMCGADGTRLLALYDVAADARARARAAEPAAAAEGAEAAAGAEVAAEAEAAAGEYGSDRPHPAARSRKRLRLRPLYAAGVCLVLVVAAGTTLLVVRPWHHASTTAAAPSYTCHVTRAADGWYAGMTRTRTALVQQGMAGPQVAEVQCLLRRAGFSPGEIDGIFGVLTQRAVQRIQAAHGLPVDGMVGPQTWGALRA